MSVLTLVYPADFAPLAAILSRLSRTFSAGLARSLDDFLVTSLERAVALADGDDVAVVVADHLHLDVARFFEIALDVDVAVAECGFCFGLRDGNRAGELGIGPGDAHAAPTAAGDRLDHYRESNLPGDPAGLGGAGDDTFGPRQQRHTGGFHRGAGFGLVAHPLDHLGLRADE